MTKTEIITLINLWIDFQNEDQPGAPRDGEKRIEWFADKNQSKPISITEIEKQIMKAAMIFEFNYAHTPTFKWEDRVREFTESPEYKAIPAAESDRDEILDCLVDVFYQSCQFDGKFDNLAISVYESAQELLIRLGKIKESDCYRK